MPTLVISSVHLHLDAGGQPQLVPGCLNASCPLSKVERQPHARTAGQSLGMEGNGSLVAVRAQHAAKRQPFLFPLRKDLQEIYFEDKKS